MTLALAGAVGGRDGAAGRHHPRGAGLLRHRHAAPSGCCSARRWPSCGSPASGCGCRARAGPARARRAVGGGAGRPRLAAEPAAASSTAGRSRGACCGWTSCRWSSSPPRSPPGTLLAKALGMRPLAAIGRRSYSLYLWHWPVIVFLRPGVDMPDRGLAGPRRPASRRWSRSTELSFRFVERPFRTGQLAQTFPGRSGGRARGRPAAAAQGVRGRRRPWSMAAIVAVAADRTDDLGQPPGRARIETPRSAGHHDDLVHDPDPSSPPRHRRAPRRSPRPAPRRPPPLPRPPPDDRARRPGQHRAGERDRRVGHARRRRRDRAAVHHRVGRRRGGPPVRRHRVGRRDARRAGRAVEHRGGPRGQQRPDPRTAGSTSCSGGRAAASSSC